MLYTPAMKKTFLLLSFGLFSVISFARDGGGSVGGGGTTLTDMFQEARSGSLYLLQQFPTSGSGYEACSDASKKWIMENLGSIRLAVNAHSLEWMPYNDEVKALNSGVNPQPSCAIVSQGKIRLSVTLCKPQVLQRKTAIEEILYAAFSDSPFRYSRQQSRTVTTCLASVLDGNFWNYTWSNNDLKSSVRDLSKKIGRLSRYSDDEAEREIRKYLEEARRDSAGILHNLDRAVIPSSVNQEVVNWLFANRTALAADIQSSPYLITRNYAQTTPARTPFEAYGHIEFSLPLCKKSIEAREDAIQILVHECTHHAPFLVRDELRADQIGGAVARIIHANSQSVYRTPEQQKEVNKEIDSLLDDVHRSLDRLNRRRRNP